MAKDLYFSILEELVAEGMDYDEAGERAYELMRERYADRVDEGRQRAKDRKIDEV